MKSEVRIYNPGKETTFTLTKFGNSVKITNLVTNQNMMFDPNQNNIQQLEEICIFIFNFPYPRNSKQDRLYISLLDTLIGRALFDEG